jgi:large subunit ribosomal protein L25
MTANLQTIPRPRLGSRGARVLRLQGRIPISVQGEGKDALHLSIEEHQFLAARRHHEHVFTLEFAEGGSDSAMVNELQWDPLGESIVHVEFRRVDLTRETEAEVPLEFLGHPKGGVLNHLVTNVEVAAIPSKIPDVIEVKVDLMEIGHPLFARDLMLPEGVRLVTPLLGRGLRLHRRLLAAAAALPNESRLCARSRHGVAVADRFAGGPRRRRASGAGGYRGTHSTSAANYF